jgi:cytochrome oxidase assembly protein ShyY1
MDRSDLPVIVIELVLVFGGTLAFGWWQLRSVKRDRERAAAARAAAQAEPAATQDTGPDASPSQPPPGR